jgi:hypothetical protein|nr:MAG TPA: Rad50 zinc hook motif [Caudoviricetes sp.]
MSNKAGSGRYQNGAARRKCKARHIAAEGPIPICPLCGREQRAQTVKLRRLKTLCWDDSRRGSAADIAKAFTDAGITLKASRVRKWVERGQVSRTPQGIPYSDVYRQVIAGQLDK